MIIARLRKDIIEADDIPPMEYNGKVAYMTNWPWETMMFYVVCQTEDDIGFNLILTHPDTGIFAAYSIDFEFEETK